LEVTHQPSASACMVTATVATIMALALPYYVTLKKNPLCDFEFGVEPFSELTPNYAWSNPKVSRNQFTVVDDGQREHARLCAH
jgi:hypothetical protein